LLEPKCYLSPFTSQSQYKCCLGDRPQFGRGVELGGWVCYPVKLLHISYNLFAGTEMLSVSLRLRANRNTHFSHFAWGQSPNLGEGVELGLRGQMCYHMKANHNGHNLSSETDTLSHFV